MRASSGAGRFFTDRIIAAQFSQQITGPARVYRRHDCAAAQPLNHASALNPEKLEVLADFLARGQTVVCSDK
jgi:phage-related baseplate assembly protein